MFGITTRYYEKFRRGDFFSRKRQDVREHEQERQSTYHASIDGGKISGEEWLAKLPANVGGLLGGVFGVPTVQINPSTGKAYQSGGTLMENVVGFGMSTGTPHILHAGETVTPAWRAGGAGKSLNVNVAVNSYLGSDRQLAKFILNILKDNLKQHGWS